MKLQARAERYKHEDLDKLKTYNETLYHMIEGYLKKPGGIPFLLVGGKGMGKTFNVMKALNKFIREDKDFLPVLIKFRENNRFDILGPEHLASKSDWGKRYKIFDKPIKTVLSFADAIVLDDIHYVCEAIEAGEYDPKLFINLLEDVLYSVKKGKRVLLIADSMLSSYKDAVHDKRYPELLKRFGEGKGEKDYLALRQVPGITPRDFKFLIDRFGVVMDAQVERFVYLSNPNPRALTKILKLFGEKRQITTDDLLELAIKRLKENDYGFGSKRRYYQFVLEILYYQFVFETLPEMPTSIYMDGFGSSLSSGWKFKLDSVDISASFALDRFLEKKIPGDVFVDEMTKLKAPIKKAMEKLKLKEKKIAEYLREMEKHGSEKELLLKPLQRIFLEELSVDV